MTYKPCTCCGMPTVLSFVDPTNPKIELVVDTHGVRIGLFGPKVPIRPTAASI